MLQYPFLLTKDNFAIINLTLSKLHHFYPSLFPFSFHLFMLVSFILHLVLLEHKNVELPCLHSKKQFKNIKSMCT